MDKINFQNLPSTATPVNATNLNQLQTNVENALVKTVITKIPTSGYLPKSITASSWQTVTGDLTVHLIPGKYLLIMSISISASSGSGIATLRKYTKNVGEENGNARQTVPIATLVSTIQIIDILDISTEADYTYNGQVYANVASSVSNAQMKIINL